MVKTLCPDCSVLQEIVCTGLKQGATGTSMWWSIVLHRHPTKPEICQGSGKRV